VQWSAYGSFLVFAVVLVLVPGPDFAVVTKNALAGGRRRGAWTGAGVACSNAVPGIAAAAGLGAVIVRVQPLFEAIKWAGVAYLLYLGVQALRAALRGQYPPLEDGAGLRRAGVAFALSHAALSLAYLLILTVSLHRLRGFLIRRRVRRSLDAVTGSVLLGFGARLAAEHA
jgi:threonine/homoserine/homoserine lactone efflux protein